MLRKVLQDTNSHALKAACFNNLAMAFWLRRMSEKTKGEPVSSEKELDYQNILPMLKKAIYHMEGEFIRDRRGKRKNTERVQ